MTRQSFGVVPRKTVNVFGQNAVHPPLQAGLIKQFLKDVNWGDLDYLIVDTPPGTSDEHLSIVQYLKVGDCFLFCVLLFFHCFFAFRALLTVL